MNRHQEDKNPLKTEYLVHIISIDKGAWFNATEVAAYFGKKPNDWLALDETKTYIDALHEFLNTSQDGIYRHQNTRNHGYYIKAKRGRNGGGHGCIRLLLSRLFFGVMLFFRFDAIFK